MKRRLNGMIGHFSAAQVEHSRLTQHDAVYDDKRVYHASLRGVAPPVLKKTQ